MKPQGAESPALALALPRFLDAGEAALVVEFGDEVDAAVNDQVLALDAALSVSRHPGISECVPTYRSLMIHYDPLALDRESLITIVRNAASAAPERHAAANSWTLPCCYDAVHGEDLDEVAVALGLTRDEVVTLHTNATFRVYMYGFAPGYAYLGGLPEALILSRRPAPRPPHPPGAVLIGGGLCGVATFSMPTGWYVLGCTPERLYAQARANQFLISPGDNLRFEPIDTATFQSLAQRTAQGEVIARKDAA